MNVSMVGVSWKENELKQVMLYLAISFISRYETYCLITFTLLANDGTSSDNHFPLASRYYNFQGMQKGLILLRNTVSPARQSLSNRGSRKLIVITILLH